MVEVFPELADTAIDYAWGGQVAFATDQMPHAGKLDGLHYAMGYAGHGVAMATWLGARMGGGTRRLRADAADHDALPCGAMLPRPALVSSVRRGGY